MYLLQFCVCIWHIYHITITEATTFLNPVHTALYFTMFKLVHKAISGIMLMWWSVSDGIEEGRQCCKHGRRVVGGFSHDQSGSWHVVQYVLAQAARNWKCRNHTSVRYHKFKHITNLNLRLFS